MTEQTRDLFHSLADEDTEPLTCHELEPGCLFYSGYLPHQLLAQDGIFETIWNMHPAEYHTIQMHGRPVKTPRWQQAYGRDYHYTGRTNEGLAIPDVLQPFLNWCQQQVDPRLNSLLLNWYDAQHGHYIGKHRDSTTQMIDGCPIVTISLGNKRTFRLRPWKQNGYNDFPVENGSVFVMTYATNLKWTHEVPLFKSQTGRRISITARGFADDQS